MSQPLYFLPPDLFVTNVLTFLRYCDFARFDEALPSVDRQVVHEQYFRRVPPVEVDHSTSLIISWFWMHNLRVKTVFLPYDDFDVSILEQNTDHFESISIWRCTIEDHAWQLLCVSMSKVLCNKVINVDAASLPENCGLIWRLMQRFHNLERLQIAAHDRSTPEKAKAVVSSNPNLRSLWLDCRSLDIPFAANVLNCPTAAAITKLNLTVHCEANEDIAVVSENCPNLQHLHVHLIGENIPIETRQSLMALPAHCQRLKTVEIETGDLLPDVLSAFVTHCPDLQSIEGEKLVLDNEALETMAERCPKLSKLGARWTVTSAASVDYCKQFLKQVLSVKLDCTQLYGTSEECLELALMYAANLVCLKLENLHPTFAAKMIYAAGKCCERLDHLHLTGREALNMPFMKSCGDALVEIARRYSATLTTLRLEDLCMNGAHLSAVTAHLPRLKYLTFYNEHVALDDDLVCAIAEHCPLLEQIEELSSSLTDRGVLALATHCPRIAWLALTHCAAVTEAALLQLARCGRERFNLYVPTNLPEDARARVLASG